MSRLVIPEQCLSKLGTLDDGIRKMNQQKIVLLLELLGQKLPATDLAAVLDWELIMITVPDQQMAVQLNKLSAYIPNLKFVVSLEEFPFTLLQGAKKRRVWKER